MAALGQCPSSSSVLIGSTRKRPRRCSSRGLASQRKRTLEHTRSLADQRYRPDVDRSARRGRTAKAGFDPLLPVVLAKTGRSRTASSPRATPEWLPLHAHEHVL